jgi:DNA invertase Pin-like site-specific DNA recombinase
MTVAAYIRASTDLQADGHQRESIRRWADEEDINDLEWYVDLDESGYYEDRSQFQALVDDLRAGELSHVVCWEISRLSRRGATLQELFDLCEEQDVVVAITDGAVDEVRPDGTGRFVADIIGMVYQQERRQLVRRVQAGVERAQREGKWVGQVPAGFERDGEGYLQPNLDPDHDAGETGYLEHRTALEQIDAGESYRSAAAGLPVSRQTLATVDQDEQRRAWYVDGEADDDRIDDALHGP